MTQIYTSVGVFNVIDSHTVVRNWWKREGTNDRVLEFTEVVREGGMDTYPSLYTYRNRQVWIDRETVGAVSEN